MPLYDLQLTWGTTTGCADFVTAVGALPIGFAAVLLLPWQGTSMWYAVLLLVCQTLLHVISPAAVLLYFVHLCFCQALC